VPLSASPAPAASVPPPLATTPVLQQHAAVTPDFVPPAKAGRTPAKTHAPAPTPAKPSVASPREACGARTDFSLYRCMQTQCAQARWHQHPSCKRLRERDEVS
jgi:hypothetical protein